MCFSKIRRGVKKEEDKEFRKDVSVSVKGRLRIAAELGRSQFRSEQKDAGFVASGFWRKEVSGP